MEVALINMGFNPKLAGFNRLIKLIKYKQQGKYISLCDGLDIVAKEEFTSPSSIKCTVEWCIQRSQSQYNCSTTIETINALAILLYKDYGLHIDNIKIVKEDGNNYSYEIYRKGFNPFTFEEKKLWKKVDKHFPTLKGVLDHLEDVLLRDRLQLEEYSPTEFIEEIRRVKKALAEIPVEEREYVD